MNWCKIIFSTVLCINNLFLSTLNAELKFGQFDLLVTNFQTCKGPKKNDCTKMVVGVKGQHQLLVDLDVTESMIPTKGKIIVIAKGKETIRLQLKNPCQHMFLKPLFDMLYNMKKDCQIKPGRYNYELDIQDIARKYYGGDFMYGNWTFKSIFHSDKCNLSCNLLDVQIVPSDTKN